jgi:CheY-like chemotaxis protein
MDRRVSAGGKAGLPGGRATLAALAKALMPGSRRLSRTPADSSARSEAANVGEFHDRLALYHRPGSVVLLDDDSDFLGMLLMALPRNWSIEAFNSPLACVNYLQKEPAQWDADLRAHQNIVEQWRAGTALIPQILRYWQECPERYKLTRVCVVDYQMPQMDGLQTLRELRGWPGHRVMMTGSIENLAPAAFNAGLIDHFVPKQTSDFRKCLVAAIEPFLEKPDPRYNQVWQSTLAPAQVEILRDKSICDDLYCFVATNFVEYMLIGDPFGIIGVDEAGVVTWLQLEPASELEALAELAAAHGASAEEVRKIQAGERVTNARLHQVLGNASPARVVPAFGIGSSGTLFASPSSIQPNADGAPALSYRSWLAMNAHTRWINQSFS